jgi:hypothetical protein
MVDEYGNELNESKVTYDKPVACKGNISAARGETVVRQFGEYESYDRVIVLENPDTPIDEYAVLWVDSTPSLNQDGTLATNDDGTFVTPWDYTVKKVAKSLNSVSIAISKVTVR